MMHTDAKGTLIDPTSVPLRSQENPPMYPGINTDDINSSLSPQSHGKNQAAAIPNPSGASMSDKIMAAQAVNTAISQNGRSPVTVVCPNCMTTCLTNITEIETTTDTTEVSIMNYICQGIALVFIVLLSIMAYVVGSWIPIGMLPIFLFILLGICCVIRKASEASAKRHTDIQHRCSACETLLGVNTWMQMQMQRYPRANRQV